MRRRVVYAVYGLGGSGLTFGVALAACSTDTRSWLAGLVLACVSFAVMGLFTDALLPEDTTPKPGASKVELDSESEDRIVPVKECSSGH